MPLEREDPTEKIERPSADEGCVFLVLHLLLTPDGQLVLVVIYTIFQQFRRAIRNTVLPLLLENGAFVAGFGLFVLAMLLGAVVGLVARRRR